MPRYGSWFTPPVQTITVASTATPVSNASQVQLSSTETDYSDGTVTGSSSSSSTTSSATGLAAVDQWLRRTWDLDVYPAHDVHVDTSASVDVQEQTVLNLDAVFAAMSYFSPPLPPHAVDVDVDDPDHDKWPWIVTVAFDLPVTVGDSPALVAASSGVLGSFVPDNEAWVGGTLNVRAARGSDAATYGLFLATPSDYTTVGSGAFSSPTLTHTTIAVEVGRDHVFGVIHYPGTSFGNNALLLDLDWTDVTPVVPTAPTTPTVSGDWIGWSGATGQVDATAIGSTGITYTVVYQPPRYRFVYDVLPPLRQYPRDDFLGGAPRQGRTSRSLQNSARQGWANAYR